MFRPVVLPVLFALSPLTVNAELVSFSIAGYVDDVSAYGDVAAAPLAVGTAFTGTFSFEWVEGWESLPASDDAEPFFARLEWHLNFEGGASASFSLPAQMFPYPVGNDAVIEQMYPSWNVGNVPQDSLELGAVAVPGVGPADVDTNLPDQGLMLFGFGFFDSTLSAFSGNTITPGDIDWSAFGDIQWFIGLSELGFLQDATAENWDGYRLHGIVTQFTPVPVPAGLPLLGSALLGLLVVKRRADRR